MALKTDETALVLASKTTDELDTAVAVKATDELDLVSVAKSRDELGLTLRGLKQGLYDLQRTSLRGVLTLLDDLDAVLTGKLRDELGLTLASKTTDELGCLVPAVDPPDIYAVYDFVEEEMEEFRITSGRLINEVSLRYNYDYAEQRFKAALTKHNPLSKLLYGEARESFELKMLQGTREAERIADAILKTSSIPEVICTFRHTLRSLHVEVGDIVSITHRAGLDLAGYINALATVTKKGIDGPTISYEVVMQSGERLYRSEMLALSQTAMAGEPGVTVQYDQGVATITIYADVQGYPPVQGAEVTISGVRKITDQNGQVRFNLAPGTYTAYIRASGYEDAEVTFTV